MTGYGLDVHTWRGRFVFSILFFFAYYSVSLLTLFVHEVLGHGLFTVLEGGIFWAFYLNPLGISASFTEWHYGVPVSPLMEGLVSASGMIMESVMGVIVLLLYPRLKGFTSRLIALIIIIQTLKGTAIYLIGGSAAGILNISQAGLDPIGVNHYLGIPLEALLILGVGMALSTSYLIFNKTAMLVQDYFLFRNKKDLFVSILLIEVVRRLISETVGGILQPEWLLFEIVGLAVSLTIYMSMGALFTKRYALLNTSGLVHKLISIRSIATFSILAILTTTIWLGAFGPTVTRAHGILLQEYPGYSNVKVNVLSDQTALVDLTYRPLGGDRMWESVKNRPNWDNCLEVTATFMEKMFNATMYTVLSNKTTEDLFWQDEEWHSGGARLVSVQLNLTESPNWQRIEDEFTLTIHDPWKPGFIDAINITSAGLSIVNYNFTPLSSTDMTEGNIQEGYLLWLTTHFEESPETYIITFK